MSKKKTKKLLISIISLAAITLAGCYSSDIEKELKKIIPEDQLILENKKNLDNKSYTLDEIPTYSGNDYVTINNNEPEFDKNDITEKSFEKYSELDSLGRCGAAYANLSKETMPTKERGSIGMIKPSGWHTIKYDNVDGKYLYNRCHLIGYQLSGENANEKNLITCTRYTNATVMLDFENKVADYIDKTNNHVLYRVTPIFENDNLLATGIQMEAYSVEDSGEGIKFNIFIFNVQDGIEIDYKTGKSKLK